MLIRWKRWSRGRTLDGKEDYEASCVDEGRCPYTQNARTREDKDDGDRAQIEAERGGNTSESNETWCYIGRRSEEEIRFPPTGAEQQPLTLRPGPSLDPTTTI
jgi:hypothetical protein